MALSQKYRNANYLLIFANCLCIEICQQTAIQSVLKLIYSKIVTKAGNFKECKWIIDHIENKNPKNCSGITPLHLAAKFGQLSVCKLIIENIEDKNSQDKYHFERAISKNKDFKKKNFC